MRRIGFIDNAAEAERFCDFLVSQRIHATAEKEDDASARHAVWIKQEQQVDEARQLLDAFLASPGDSRFDAGKLAAEVRRKEAEENRKLLKNLRKVSSGSLNPMAGRTPVTFIAIGLCVLVGLLTGFGNPSVRIDRTGREIPTLESRVYDAMTFVDRHDRVKPDDAFVSIRKGEVWRVLTPALMHGNMGHLAMNMMGLFFLGSVIERLHGGGWLVAMLLVIAVVANLVQVFWPETNNGGPNAVGSSGATYGLFGFFLMRKHFDPSYPVGLPPMFQLVGLGFLVLGVLMVVPNVANGSHVGGLACGMLFAAIVPTENRSRRGS